jgi:hypothetical protein
VPDTNVTIGVSLVGNLEAEINKIATEFNQLGAKLEQTVGKSMSKDLTAPLRKQFAELKKAAGDILVEPKISTDSLKAFETEAKRVIGNVRNMFANVAGGSAKNLTPSSLYAPELAAAQSKAAVMSVAKTTKAGKQEAVALQAALQGALTEAQLVASMNTAQQKKYATMHKGQKQLALDVQKVTLARRAVDAAMQADADVASLSAAKEKARNAALKRDAGGLGRPAGSLETTDGRWGADRVGPTPRMRQFAADLGAHVSGAAPKFDLTTAAGRQAYVNWQAPGYVGGRSSQYNEAEIRRAEWTRQNNARQRGRYYGGPTGTGLGEWGMPWDAGPSHMFSGAGGNIRERIGGVASATGGAIREGVNTFGRGMGSAVVYVPAYSAVRGIGNVMSDVITQRHRGEFTESAVNMYAAGATKEQVEAAFMTGTDISAKYGGLKGIGSGDFASMRAEFMGLGGTKNMAPGQMDKLTENAIVGARLGKMTPQQAQLEMPTVFELLTKHPQFKDIMAKDPAAGFTKFQNMVRAGETFSSGWFRDLIASGRYTFQSLLNTGRPIEQEIGMAFSARAMGMKANTQGRQLRHLTGKNMEDINRIVAMGATRGKVLESRYLPEDPYKLTPQQLKWMSKQPRDFFVRGAKAFTPAYVSKSGVQTHNRRVITKPLPEFGGQSIEQMTPALYAEDPSKLWNLVGESSSRADDIFGKGEARRGVKSLEVLGVMDSMNNPLIREQVKQVSAEAKEAFHGQGDTVTGADKLLDASTVYQRATANFSRDVAQFAASNSFLSNFLSRYAPDSTQTKAQQVLKNEADLKYWNSLSDPNRKDDNVAGDYWGGELKRGIKLNRDYVGSWFDKEGLASGVDLYPEGMEGAMESVVAAGGKTGMSDAEASSGVITDVSNTVAASISTGGTSIASALAGVAAAIAGIKIAGPGMAQDVRVGGSAEVPPQGGYTN